MDKRSEQGKLTHFIKENISTTLNLPGIESLSLTQHWILIDKCCILEVSTVFL